MKSNVQLQRDVLDELDWERSVDAAQIGVTAKEGMVTLTGHVPVYAEKHLAEEVAKRVHGVRAVVNEIEVRPSDAHVRDDEDIASAVLHVLQWDAKVPDDRLMIAVEGGWITVEGTVEEQFQRHAVDRAVRNLVGARGVTNAIAVAPQELNNEISADIEAAFRRSATLDSTRLSFEVEGRSVILTGDVHSHRELEDAERIAWAARGVLQVKNCITITPWGRLGPQRSGATEIPGATEASGLYKRERDDMTQANGDFNPFDPTGMLKEMRDANIDAWAKMMVELVNSDAYAQSTGTMLDTWLTSSGPFRKSIETSMGQTLAQLNLPTRDDVTRIAERLTNIEMRLDDLEAKLG